MKQLIAKMVRVDQHPPGWYWVMIGDMHFTASEDKGLAQLRCEQMRENIERWLSTAEVPRASNGIGWGV